MEKNPLLFFLSAVSGLLLLHCAQPIPPQGGPRDRQPPGIVEESSSPNFQTNFQKQDIILTFDEWISLKDQFNQVVISPPLQRNPEIRVRGKSVVVTFAEEEEFTPNTTYTINFGSAIIDLTESNVLHDYKYVFSTGTFIDSLFLEGRIYQAENGKPAKDVLVILHNPDLDSAIYQERPSYFTRTDSSGNFRLDYLRSDSFYIYALRETNPNYRLDQEGEEVGFYSNLVSLPDTALDKITFPIYKPRTKLRITSRKQLFPGSFRIAFNREPIGFDLEILEGNESSEWSLDTDTLRIWCRDGDSLKFTFSTAGPAFIDTLQFACFNGILTQQAKPALRRRQSNVLPNAMLPLEFNLPVEEIDLTSLALSLGDTAIIAAEALNLLQDSVDSRKLKMGHAWQEKAGYVLYLYPGAIDGYFRQVNDTIKLPFRIDDPELLSNLILTITGTDSLERYVLVVIQDNKELERRLFEGGEESIFHFPGLKPRPLILRLIEDKNRNGIWDPGNLEERRQPEPVLEAPVESLKSSWDVDFTLQWLN